MSDISKKILLGLLLLSISFIMFNVSGNRSVRQYVMRKSSWRLPKRFKETDEVLTIIVFGMGGLAAFTGGIALLMGAIVQLLK
jgi:hypothetical protein